MHAHQRPKLERYDDSLFTVFKTIRYVEHAELTATSEVVETGEVMVLHRPGLRHHRAARRPRLAARAAAPAGGRPRAAGQGPLRGAARHRRPGRRRLPRGRRRRPGRHRRGRDRRLLRRPRQVRARRRRRAASTSSSARCWSSSGRSRRCCGRCSCSSERPMRLVDPEIQKYFRDVADHLARVHEQVTRLRRPAQLDPAGQPGAGRPSRRTRTCARSPRGRPSSPCPTMITGIYGMNFDHMPELHWRYGYPAVLGVDRAPSASPSTAASAATAGSERAAAARRGRAVRRGRPAGGRCGTSPVRRRSARITRARPRGSRRAPDRRPAAASGPATARRSAPRPGSPAGSPSRWWTGRGRARPG